MSNESIEPPSAASVDSEHKPTQPPAAAAESHAVDASDANASTADPAAASAGTAGPAAANASTAGAPAANVATRTSAPSATPAQSAKDPPPAGTILASEPRRGRERYEIIAEHGRGGLGRVSRARDRELERDVAIKELLSRNHVSELRFFREALITARLEHPGIVPVHEAGRWPDGTPFYAMKLVAGRPLRDLIEERATVAERLGLLHHVIAVADAIAYAHDRKIIHRDLKPGNVIVGDFGETVVIDWGLAKDLTTSEDVAPDTGPFRAQPHDGLTRTGSVLGTPAYMAPEQERGEHVDQRADVFAIGAMLWELCALQRVPPLEPRARHRLLRRAGIDRDLIVIIEKALAPDARDRYPDAGALAADLKAFKAGARIAARSYSLPAMLAHWIRRHRALSLSLVLAVVVATAAAILYVHNVATERDHADAALAKSEIDRNALTLEHAALLLHSDPTAAVAALANYHGHDDTRRAQLLAEADGRGVARRVLQLHNDTVWLLAEQPDGALISLGEDHRIQRTTEHGTTTLASDVSGTVTFAYSAERDLIAYAKSPAGIALLDLGAARVVQLAQTVTTGLAFSQDGTKLAALSKQGELIVWRLVQTPTIIYRGASSEARWIRYMANGDVLLIGHEQLEVRRQRDGSSVTLSSAPQYVDVRDNLITLGQADGKVILLSSDLKVIASLPVCKQRVALVQFVAKHDMIMFGCSDSGAGLVSYSTAAKVMTEASRFRTTAGVSRLTSDPTGTYVAASSVQTAYVHFINADLTIHMDGQGALISSLAAFVTDSPRLLTGDVNGRIREWKIYPPEAQVLARVPGYPIGARFTPDGATVAVYGTDPVIQLIRTDGQSKSALHGHTGFISGVHFTSDGSSLMSFSQDGTAQAWDLRSGERRRLITEHQGMVEDGDFLAGTHQAVTVADDGRLLKWSVDDSNITECFSTHTAFVALETLSNTNAVAVHDANNALWVIDANCKATQIRAADPIAITIMRASPDGAFLAIGRETGAVTIFRTAGWTIARELEVGGDVGQIEFNPQRPEVLVLAENSSVHLQSLDLNVTLAWHSLQVDALNIDYAPDGSTLAIVTRDGGSWFYSLDQDRWRYTQDHDGEIRGGKFSPDSRRFLSVGDDQAVVIRDMKALFHKSLH